jgi:hypothetical protein
MNETGVAIMKTITRRTFAGGIATLPALHFTAAHAQASVTPAEARAIAKEAYVYGFPVVDSYRVQYAYFVDRDSPEYKAPWNQIRNNPHVGTPADKAVQAINTDTPYSWIGMDLRAEPLVLTLPVIEKDRYFSVQLIDLYTFDFDYMGSRTTGNDGGSFLVAGPGWKGETPKGVKKVFRSECELGQVWFRTQLFNPGDIDNVKKVQDGYKVQTLSAFLGQPAPNPAPTIEFIKPLTPEQERTSLEVFNILNFVLQFCPTDPSETQLMERFAKIGVGAGKTFDASQLSPEMKTAIEQGMADAWADFANVKKQIEEGKVGFGDMFGTRAHLKNNYLYRMVATLGLYGNTKEEAIYLGYFTDGDGKKLDAANRYTLRFAAGELPPVNAFWSLTMYDFPAELLVANPLNRYVLNSPMLPQFKRDADGGLTLYIQSEPPGGDKESNWLPAPKGPFAMAMRLYWPKPAALDGKWKHPPVMKVA